VAPGEVYSLAEHALSRPASGETKTISLVNSLAPENAKLHYCHISSTDSFSAMKPGSTFEVAPHHLFLSYETAKNAADTHMRMNPPLREESERKRLLAAFDKIDVIASDHAPHTIKEKSAEFASAPSGIPGVETMLPLLMNEVHAGRMNLNAVIEKTVTNPNRILGIESPAFMPGARADFAVYADSPVKIDAENLHSKCGWSPYEGMYALFPEITVVSGVCAWKEGDFSREGACFLRG
ncbi:MAG TPA: dihydroorotase, partial [Methanocorpusculum sp.]|nr:dihydroorotase [Methanocorpusculum sp.]